MALSQLSKNIRRFAKLHAQKKAADAELDVLKADFRARAGTEDAVFAYRDIEVPVTWKERESFDSAALTFHLGDKAGEFKKTSRYAEVSCRKREKA